MKCLVTGGAGFIGSSLTDRLLENGHQVIVYDNFSTGAREFLSDAYANSAFKLIEGDLLDIPGLADAMRGVDIVFHLAANADVRFGTSHPEKDLQQNTIATFNVLEAMRANGIGRIVFSSTGSVYGEAKIVPTPEDAPFPIQTSLYAASKLAGEGLLEAYCEGFGLQAWIFRFVSVLGPRYTHGHVFDFYRMLRANPDQLHVLGDGKQQKSYMAVSDCIDGMLLAVRQAKAKINIFNLGTDEVCTVNQSIDWICQRLGLKPVLSYSGGSRGWIGDNPLIYLDTRSIRELGWVPKSTIREAIISTLEWLLSNSWVYDRQK
jgi:UDP-glucose 4-epimerase